MQEGLFKIGNVGQGVVCALFRAGIHSFVTGEPADKNLPSGEPF